MSVFNRVFHISNCLATRVGRSKKNKIWTKNKKTRIQCRIDGYGRAPSFIEVRVCVYQWGWSWRLPAVWLSTVLRLQMLTTMVGICLLTARETWLYRSGEPPHLLVARQSANWIHIWQARVDPPTVG